MITHAHITATLQPSDPHDQSQIERGDPKFRVGVNDLLRFGDSPRRWRLTPLATDPPKPRSIQGAEPTQRGIIPADDIDLFLSGNSVADVADLMRIIIATAQRDRLTASNAQGFVDFQLTRGLLGLTT